MAGYRRGQPGERIRHRKACRRIVRFCLNSFLLVTIQSGKILIYRAVYGYAKGSKKGTGNREQGTGKAARKTIQPGQRKRFRDKMRRRIPENPVAAT